MIPLRADSICVMAEPSQRFTCECRGRCEEINQECIFGQIASLSHAGITRFRSQGSFLSPVENGTPLATKEIIGQTLLGGDRFVHLRGAFWDKMGEFHLWNIFCNTITPPTLTPIYPKCDNLTSPILGGSGLSLSENLGQPEISDKGVLVKGARSEAYAFLRPPESHDEIGRLGGYSLLGVLGKGGMGMVFLAHDPMLDRKLALKVMIPEVASPDNRERFFREARSVAALTHDNIVPIFQIGEDNGVPFLTMPFLQGEPLDKKLDRERKPKLRETLRIIRETLAGLSAAHAKGLIHRDIKPGNLWLEGPRGRVRILDFGLARTRTQDARITQAGAIMGTPAYMAPEQAGGQEVTAQADLFSVGVIFYEMLLGTKPFKGNDTLAILSSLLTTQPPEPCLLDQQIPDVVSQLAMNLIAKDPSKRPASARDAGLIIVQLEKDLPTLSMKLSRAPEGLVPTQEDPILDLSKVEAALLAESGKSKSAPPLENTPAPKSNAPKSTTPHGSLKDTPRSPIYSNTIAHTSPPVAVALPVHEKGSLPSLSTGMKKRSKRSKKVQESSFPAFKVIGGGLLGLFVLVAILVFRPFGGRIGTHGETDAPTDKPALSKENKKTIPAPDKGKNTTEPRVEVSPPDSTNKKNTNKGMIPNPMEPAPPNQGNAGKKGLDFPPGFPNDNPKGILPKGQKKGGPGPFKGNPNQKKGPGPQDPVFGNPKGQMK